VLMKRKSKIPDCLRIMGFADVPETKDQLKARYKELARKTHPDRGGNPADFVRVRKAYEDTIKLIKQKVKEGECHVQ
jgi:curved DNA-binding protein CbpA